MLPISQYKTILFDCDGVILNSNFLKIEAYRLTALEFGASEEDAMRLVNHHIEYTGISRNIKFAYFLETILKKPADESAMNHLLRQLNIEVERLLENCDIAEGLENLREKTKQAHWMIVSGGDQEEIIRLFSRKKNNLDFIFLSDWTNFFEWKHFCEENKIEVYQKLNDLNR
jgi:beta-phosphoglucomutase-like phosphatase (HAD superfamily)